jgi:hypothetical protein
VFGYKHPYGLSCHPKSCPARQTDLGGNVLDFGSESESKLIFESTKDVNTNDVCIILRGVLLGVQSMPIIFDTKLNFEASKIMGIFFLMESFWPKSDKCVKDNEYPSKIMGIDCIPKKCRLKIASELWRSTKTFPLLPIHSHRNNAIKLILHFAVHTVDSTDPLTGARIIAVAHFCV